MKLWQNGQLFAFYFCFQFICINTLCIDLCQIYFEYPFLFLQICFSQNFHRILLSQICSMHVISAHLFSSVKEVSVLKHTLYYQDRFWGLILTLTYFCTSALIHHLGKITLNLKYFQPPIATHLHQQSLSVNILSFFTFPSSQM